jgi:hypothetical protein
MLAKIEQYIGCLVDEVLFALDGEPDQEALVKRLEALEVRWSSEWHKDLEDSFDGDLGHLPHPLFGRAVLVAIEYCEERASANRALRRTEVATHFAHRAIFLQAAWAAIMREERDAVWDDLAAVTGLGGGVSIQPGGQITVSPPAE